MAAEGSREKRIKVLKLAGLAALMIVLAALAAFYAYSLPKEAAPAAAADIRPELSAASGFYDAPFELTIDAGSPEYTVYYTLDGSIPDRDSLVYSGPLYIYDATENPNVLAAREDLSAGYIRDRMYKDYYYTAEYMVPDFNVDKCTVIRAVGIAEDGSRTEEASASYFVGFQDKTGYYNDKVISLVTDPDNLLDHRTGILVLGQEFDVFQRIASVLGKTESWYWWDANYRKQGDAWEREAEISLFNNDKSYAGSQACGIRVHGNISRARLPRSLSFYAREEYSGTNRFDMGLWEDYDPQKFTLYGQDAFRKTKEYVITEAVKDIGSFSSIDFSPCVLFINGEYFGNYMLGEKFDNHYIAQKYGVDTESVMLVKDNQAVDGGTEALRAFKRDHYFVSMHDMTDPENYDRAAELFDLDSYIDYYAVKIYVADTDWPMKNYAVWRSDSGNSVYADGKWRWMLFDLNIGTVADEPYSEYDMVVHAMRKDHMFASLMANEDFRTRFFERLYELADNELSPYAMKTRLTEYNRTMAEELEKEKERFYGRYKVWHDDYQLESERAVTFFRDRADYIKTAYINWNYKEALRQIQWPAFWHPEYGPVAFGFASILICIGVLIYTDIRRNGRHGKNRA